MAAEKSNHEHEAHSFYTILLQIHDQLHTRDDALIISVLIRLGKILERQPNFAAAQPIYERLIKAQSHIDGGYSQAIKRSITALGWTHQMLGNYVIAQALSTHALMLCERLDGPMHYDTAMALINRAAALGRQGLYAEAIPCFERALAIRTHLLGEHHIQTINTMGNLAVTYESDGRPVIAAALLERVDALKKEALARINAGSDPAAEVNHPTSES